MTPAGGSPLLDPHLRRVALAIGYLALFVGGIFALSLAWPAVQATFHVLAPFIVGFVVAYIFNPVVTFTQRRLRLTRIGGIIILYLGLLLFAGAFLALVVPILYTQAGNAVQGIRETVPRQAAAAMKKYDIDLGELQVVADDWLTSQGLTVSKIAADAVRNASVRNAAKSAAVGGVEILGEVLGTVVRIVAWAASSAGFLVFVFLVSLYLLVDFSKLRPALAVALPERHEPRFFEVLGKVDNAVGGFIRGQAIDCFLVGLLVFAGLMLLGLKQYALLIGFLAGVGNAVPYLGTVVGATPALLYMIFSESNPTSKEKLIGSLSVLALFATIQAIDGFIFQPKIVGKSAQLHPVAVLFALVVGAQFGLVGMVLAVPGACIARVLLKEFFWDERERAYLAASGAGSLSRIVPKQRG